MTNIVNLTPHSINILRGDGSTLTLPPSGIVARCSTNRVQIGDVNGIPVNQTQFGDVTDLPPPQPDTVFIVSALVANASDRDDLLVPDDTVRDDQGRIIGCRALARV